MLTIACTYTCFTIGLGADADHRGDLVGSLGGSASAAAVGIANAQRTSRTAKLAVVNLSVFRTVRLASEVILVSGPPE
jgi:hypothetical protein